MSRSHHYRAATRISRPLIAALGVTVVLGGFIYFHNHKPKAQRRAGQQFADREAGSLVAAPIKPSDAAPSNAVMTVTGSGSTTAPDQAARRGAARDRWSRRIHRRW